MGAASRYTCHVRCNLLLAAILVLAACRDSTPEGVSLAFSTSPLGPKVAGGLLGPVTVSVLDEDGRVVSSSQNAITIALANPPSSGGLAGTLTTNAVNGVATFGDLRIERASPQYALTASSPGLASATSTSFAITPGIDAQLAFSVQPVATIANVQIPPLIVEVTDAFGNRSSLSGRTVSLSIGSNPTAATMIGQVSRPVVSGAVTFGGLTITKPGRYTINAASQNLPTKASEPFDMTIGPATVLSFTRVPFIAGIGEVFDPPPTVSIFDAGNNLVSSASYVINLGLAPSQSGGSLSGSKTATASGGVAVFPGLSISASGTDYRIVATSPSVAGSWSSSPITVRDQIAFSNMSSGYFHSCGRGMDGKVYCWGDNTDGQLAVSGDRRGVPSPINSALDFVSVSAGRSHSCGLIGDGTAYCWGANSSGQAGPISGGSNPGRVSDVVKFTSIHAGYSHSCGLDSSGKAYCWGSNTTGELGAPGAPGSFVAVSGGISFSNISAGRFFTCGAAVNGTGYCWGENSLGEIGDGTVTRRSVPTPISGGLNFKAVLAGGFHACGLTTQGKAYCWGQNSTGQLGNDRTVDSSTPVAVNGGLTFVALTAGNRHTCGITDTGQAYCWGDNSTGALGVNTSSPTVSVPTLVSSSISFTGISAGRFHTCAVASGASYCWGYNGSLLGTGKESGTGVPEVVR